MSTIWLAPSHKLNLPISFHKLARSASLFFKYIEYCRGRYAVKEPGGKWTCRNVFSCLVAVFPLDGLEDVLELQK